MCRVVGKASALGAGSDIPKSAYSRNEVHHAVYGVASMLWMRWRVMDGVSSMRWMAWRAMEDVM